MTEGELFYGDVQLCTIDRRQNVLLCQRKTFKYTVPQGRYVCLKEVYTVTKPGPDIRFYFKYLSIVDPLLIHSPSL